VRLKSPRRECMLIAAKWHHVVIFLQSSGYFSRHWSIGLPQKNVKNPIFAPRHRPQNFASAGLLMSHGLGTSKRLFGGSFDILELSSTVLENVKRWSFRASERHYVLHLTQACVGNNPSDEKKNMTRGRAEEIN
jgi:hypothetical protein